MKNKNKVCKYCKSKHSNTDGGNEIIDICANCHLVETWMNTCIQAINNYNFIRGKNRKVTIKEFTIEKC